jgi:hypothetical protein
MGQSLDPLSRIVNIKVRYVYEMSLLHVPNDEYTVTIC